MLVGGTLTSNGNNTIQGAIITGLNLKLGMAVPQEAVGNGNKTFQYSSCNLMRALGHVGSLQRVRNGWVDTWSSYCPMKHSRARTVMSVPTRTIRQAAGFTLVEILVSITILAVRHPGPGHPYGPGRPICRGCLGGFVSDQHHGCGSRALRCHSIHFAGCRHHLRYHSGRATAAYPVQHDHQYQCQAPPGEHCRQAHGQLAVSARDSVVFERSISGNAESPLRSLTSRHPSERPHVGFGSVESAGSNAPAHRHRAGPHGGGRGHHLRPGLVRADITGDRKAQQGAFAVAQSGLNRYLSDLNAAKPVGPWPMTVTYNDLPGGTARVDMVQLRESTTTLLPAIYSITSRGRYTAAKRYELDAPSAERTVATYALWTPDSVRPQRGVHQPERCGKTVRSGILSGVDNCGAQPPIPGVRFRRLPGRRCAAALTDHPMPQRATLRTRRQTWERQDPRVRPRTR